MATEIGDHPVTLCPPGVAVGIIQTFRATAKTRDSQQTTPRYAHDATRPLRRLAQAKIALAFYDLMNTGSKNETLYNRNSAKNFLLSVEVFFWCDMAGLNAATVRSKAKALIEKS